MMFNIFHRTSRYHYLWRRTINLSVLNKTTMCETSKWPWRTWKTPNSFSLPRRNIHHNQQKTSRLPFEVDTNVAKDVMLYTYDNIRLHRTLNFFGLTQFCFWMYLSHFAYTCLKDTPDSKTEKNEKEPFWRRINLGENKYRNGITLMCVSLGYVILIGCWMFSLRSVRRLVLRKGGQSIEFVTYTPFARLRYIEIPTENLTCRQSRESSTNFIAVKAKGYWMYFLMDNRRGIFTNTKLFDYTVGIKRVWK